MVERETATAGVAGGVGGEKVELEHRAILGCGRFAPDCFTIKIALPYKFVKES
jgi:hypothetical protein